MIEPWIGAWLRRQLVDRHDGGRCVRLQLLHLGGRQTGVRTWEIPPERCEESALDVYAAEILDAAQEDAAARFGRQRYMVCAYYAASPGAVAESRVFNRYGGGEEDGEEEVDSEGPTSRGLLTQLMRHNEANARAVVGQTQQILRAQGDMLERALARVSSMEERHGQAVQIYETLLTDRHTRELATKEHELKVRAWTEGFEKLSLLVPVLVNKAAGVRLLPEPASVTNAIVESIVDSITPEQAEKMAGVLTPEQMIALMSLVEDRRKQQAARQAGADAKVRAADGGAPGNGSAGAGAQS